MMSALAPRSSRTFSSSTLMKVTGYSGGAAGAAPASRTPAATTPISVRRICSSPDDSRAAPHRRPAVAETLGLHRLSLAAVGYRVEAEVRADRVHVHEVVARVGGDPAVAVESAQLAVSDLVDTARRDAEVLAALGDRWRPMAGDVVAVVDFLQDVLRRARARIEDGVRHTDQGDQGGVRGLPVTVGLAAEDRRRLSAVHETPEDAAVDMDHAPRGRTLVVVLVVAETRERRVRVRGHERRGHAAADLMLGEAAEKPGAPGVCGLHLQGAVELDRVADDLVRHEGVVVRIGHHDHLAIRRRQDGRGRERHALARQSKREVEEGREAQERLVDALEQNLPAPLVAEGIIEVLAHLSGDGDDRAGSLGQRERLIDAGALARHEQLTR